MPITLDFTGKLVLVTGGGRGIGLAISKALAEAGADVAISYTSKDATPVAKELSDKYGTKVRAFKCEITKSSEVDALVEEVKKEYGKDVDIGVANAGKPVFLYRGVSCRLNDCFRRCITLERRS